MEPTLVAAHRDWELVRRETFAPILYVMEYGTLEDAIALNNSVPQGLSSSLFTRDLRHAELFLSSIGSDCGIANVNVGTSGAEIGGAFGGEKETGGGRSRFGRVAGLHAPADEHDQLGHRSSACARHTICRWRVVAE